MLTKLASLPPKPGALSTNLSAFKEDSKISVSFMLADSRIRELIIASLSNRAGIKAKAPPATPLISCLSSSLDIFESPPNNFFMAEYALGSNASLYTSSNRVPNSLASFSFRPSASCMYCRPLSAPLLYAYKL